MLTSEKMVTEEIHGSNQTFSLPSHNSQEGTQTFFVNLPFECNHPLISIILKFPINWTFRACSQLLNHVMEPSDQQMALLNFAPYTRVKETSTPEALHVGHCSKHLELSMRGRRYSIHQSGYVTCNIYCYSLNTPAHRCRWHAYSCTQSFLRPPQ